MANSSVVVYCRSDLFPVRQLAGELERAGYSLWIDVDRLRSGESWAETLRGKVASCRSLLIVRSLGWMYDGAFLRRELTMALDAVDAVQGGVALTCLNLDESLLPPDLAALDWETAAGDMEVRALTAHLGKPAPPTTNQRALAIWRAHVATASEELRTLRVRLRQGLGPGIDLLDAARYQDFVDAWEPFLDSSYFRVEHPAWADSPREQVSLHAIKSMLFISFAQLGQTVDSLRFAPLAFRTLQEIVSRRPFEPVNAGLDAEHTRIQNENYLNTLNFAMEWFEGWSPQVFTIFSIPVPESERLVAEVAERVAELERSLAADV